MKKTASALGSIIVTELSVILLSFIFGVLIMYGVKNAYISSALTLLIYISMMYSAGWREGKKDSKRLSENFPNVKRAYIAALIAGGITAVLLFARVLAYELNPTKWEAYGTGFELIRVKSGVLMTFDIIYKAWNFYFVGFMNDEKFITYLLPVIFPVLIYPIGYMVGLKRFSITEKYMPQILYRPKDKK